MGLVIKMSLAKIFLGLLIIGAHAYGFEERTSDDVIESGPEMDMRAEVFNEEEDLEDTLPSHIVEDRIRGRKVGDCAGQKDGILCKAKCKGPLCEGARCLVGKCLNGRMYWRKKLRLMKTQEKKRTNACATSQSGDGCKNGKRSGKCCKGVCLKMREYLYVLKVGRIC